MVIRNYHPDDFAAVLALINAAAETDRTRRIAEGVLRAALAPTSTHDRLPETAVAVARGGVVGGFAWWAVSAPHVMRMEGWVHPDHRRQGLGTALLTAVEIYAREQLHGARIEARSYADIPGSEALFRLKGYTLVRRFYTMTAPLGGRVFDPQPPPGIALRAFTRESLEMLVDADNEIFADHWGSHPRTVRAWAQHMIEMRPHDPALWVIAWEADEIVGECLCHASREGGPNDGWVSIVGVRRSWRGRGLGRALLMSGLKRLQDRGFQTASLNVDAENTAAINLYRSLEMNVARTRLHFSRTVSG